MHRLCRASGDGAHALRHSHAHFGGSSSGRVGRTFAGAVARGRLGSILPRQAAMSTESSTPQKGGSLLGRFAAWYNKCESGSRRIFFCSVNNQHGHSVEERR